MEKYTQKSCFYPCSLYLSGSQQETSGTLKLGQFEEDLFTKGLITKVWEGCRGIPMNRGITQLAAVELLPPQGSERKEPTRSFKKPVTWC